MKRFIMILIVLLGITLGVEAKTKIKGEENVYYFDVSTTTTTDINKVNAKNAENNAINESLNQANKQLKDGNFVVIPASFYNEKQLESKRLMIDTDTFDGVWFVDIDSGEFTEVKGFDKEFLKEELAEATFDEIQFKMIWGKIYVNIDNLKDKGILKDKSPKPATFKLY